MKSLGWLAEDWRGCIDDDKHDKCGEVVKENELVAILTNNE